PHIQMGSAKSQGVHGEIMMPAIDSFLATWSPRVLSILRIIVGLLFLEHGTSKYFKFASFAFDGSGAHIALRHQRYDRACRRGADRARLVHTSGRVHPGRRHGRRILHSACAEGLLSAPKRG